MHPAPHPTGASLLRELALNVFDLMVNGIFVLEISLKSFAFGSAAESLCSDGCQLIAP